MSKQVRRRRGTTAEHSTFVGAQAEITVDTTKVTAVVHDGLTVGGFPLAQEGRQIATGSGLSGGGDLSANRTLALNVPGLTEDADPDLSADYILTYDVSAAQHKRILYTTFGVQYLWKACRNESGTTISKGTPVYITGRNGDAVTVAVADASDPLKMPAIGVVTTNLANNTSGIVVTSGFVRGVDAGAGVVGQTLYVAPGGGWTTTKPSNPNLIQNVGKIVKEGSNGNLLIFGPGRTNDVPALANGTVFIGNALGNTEQRALTPSDVGVTGSNISVSGLTIAETTANEVPLTVSGYSLTGSGSQSLLDLSGTWNTTGTPTAISLNITDTASNAASLLMDLQTGGTTRFAVSKTGTIAVGSGTQTSPAVRSTADADTGMYFSGNIIMFSADGATRFGLDAVGSVLFSSISSIKWGSAAGSNGGAADITLLRDTTGILAQRNGTNTQALRVYRTFTDASNYEALELAHATYSGGQYSILQTITAGTGADNINLVLSSSGSGAITVQVPDGTITGGNVRGGRAIDLQFERNNVAQVASGNQSVLIGGRRNRATTSYSACVGGQENTATGGGCFVGNGNSALGTDSVTVGGQSVTASGAYSMAQGRSSLADKWGQHAHAAGLFSTSGDAQRSVMVMRNSTADATPTELFFDGSSLRATLPNNTRWLATVRVVATTATATGAWAVFERRCLIGRGANAAATALAGSVIVIGSDSGTNSGSPPAGWAVALTADTTNGSLKVEATGAAATAIRWVAEVSLVEVAYA